MAPAPIETQDSETVIFLDVDGVLNIGIHDEGNAPLLLRDEDVRTAKKLAKRGYRGPEAHCVAKLSALAEHPVGHMENGTYEELMTRNGEEVSDVLVRRLTEVMESAGEKCQVILSSSWRRPHHRNRRRRLEQIISRHLGLTFDFHGTTPIQREEKCAADRLLTIADHLKAICARRPSDAPELRVLVLEDFFITGMDGWKCGDQRMDSVAAAERWLKEKAAVEGSISVKLVHCYEEVVTDTGMKMQIGRGFTQQSFLEAKQFVAPLCSVSLEHCDPGQQGEETPPFPPAPEPKSPDEQEKGFLKIMSSWMAPSSMVRVF